MDLLRNQFVNPSYRQPAVTVAHVRDDLNEALQFRGVPLSLLDDMIRYLL
jgi:hypothetical protein